MQDTTTTMTTIFDWKKKVSKFKATTCYRVD